MREVRIKDSLSGETVKLDRGREVGIYACGPTVYGRIHIGNARPFVIFSLFARFLREEGYGARLVINITDINDKIYEAAGAAELESDELATQMADAYIRDTDRLGLGRPDAEPRATTSIGDIVDLIAKLVESGHAYASGGDVYFRVASFGEYGKLSNRRLEDMDQGEEAGTASLKESPLDFALWKAHKPGEDTFWESPWGVGRPGWHIECSAMAEAELGVEFAIHGGGSDLVFPHHENEIAQSEAAHGRPLARAWMHNGMIETDAAKMSKSDGNIFQLAEALDRFGAEAVVAYLTSGHYRQPLAFSEDALEASRARVARFRNFFASADSARAEPGGVDPAAGSGPASDVEVEAEERFRAVLADDFNTPQAWAVAAELLAAANRGEAPAAAPVLARMMKLLGLDGIVADTDRGGPDAEAQALLAEREAARLARDFERADQLRDQLAELGWQVRDSADGASLIPPGR